MVLLKVKSEHNSLLHLTTFQGLPISVKAQVPTAAYMTVLWHLHHIHNPSERHLLQLPFTPLIPGVCQASTISRFSHFMFLLSAVPFPRRPHGLLHLSPSSLCSNVTLVVRSSLTSYLKLQPPLPL